MRQFLLFLGFFWTFFPATHAQYSYTLQGLAPNSHNLEIGLTVASAGGDYTDLSLAAWRPGRYFLQHYAAAVFDFAAYDDEGNGLRWAKVDMNTWRVYHGSAREIRVEYRYHANNEDAGSSYYSFGQISLNPVNLFMYVPGRLEEPVTLQVLGYDPDWGIASAMAHTPEGQFQADSWHEFADSPTVLAAKMRTLRFSLDGVDLFAHFAGNYLGDSLVDQTIVEMLEAICAEQAAVFGGYPFDQYHFIFRLLPYRMSHAVEHSRSAMFVKPETVTQSPDAARKNLMGISAHELWHAWNVKRIRPAALWPYDYSQPQYTSLHWFTEGVTEYFSDLTLVRAGLIDEEEFLRRVANSIAEVENSYAATVVSPSSSSLNSWLARSDYLYRGRYISYYTLGARMGFLIDLELRHRTGGDQGLDDLFVWLFQKYYQQGEGVPEDGIQEGLEALTGDSWQAYFADHIHGTERIDYAPLLASFGLELEINNRQNLGAQAIGITRTQSVGEALYIAGLNPGGVAFKAGLTEGDLLVYIDGKPAVTLDLEAHFNEVEPGDEVELKVYREGDMVTLPVTFDPAIAPRDYLLKVKSGAKPQVKQRFSDLISSQKGS